MPEHQAKHTILDARAANVVDRLHREARKDLLRVPLIAPTVLFRKFVRGQALFQAATPGLMRDMYIPVSRDQGALLYLTARAMNAKTIVEFGTSFGVSTIYLAAAVRDNGGGVVVGTEMEPGKCRKAEEHLAEAGLAEFVEVREGDARETLKDLPAPVDMALLDGWKDVYLPIIKTLTPHFARGAVVFADNIFTFKKDLRPYVAHMQDPANGFVSTTLEMSDGFEYSVYIGKSA